MKKKLKDFLVVASIGDQFGVPYEFGNKNQGILLPHPSYNYSDDTVCTFGIAKAFMEGLDLEKTLRESCQKEPNRGYGGTFRKWIYSENMGPYGSWGNGAGMRVSSAALLAGNEDECLELAKKSAEVTHNHPEGIKGAQAVALAIYLCLEGATKEDIREKVLNRFYPDYPYKTYDEILAISTFDVSCQGSIPPVLIAFLESTSYIDCLEKVYRYRADTDTQGIMISGIGYAFYEEVPELYIEMAKKKLPSWMLEVNEEYNNRP